MQRAQSLRPLAASAPRPSAAQSNPMLAHQSIQQGHTTYYAFNYPDGGFAIIGGDAMARQVLGYAERGTFHPDSIPDGLKLMLTFYDEQILHAIQQRQLSRITPTPMPKTTGKTDIPAMLQTQWDQGEPYNSQIPIPANILPALI